MSPQGSTATTINQLGNGWMSGPLPQGFVDGPVRASLSEWAFGPARSRRRLDTSGW
ncbi:hypothetical protein GCM10027562_29360 [Arthrobacter pigmenti]